MHPDVVHGLVGGIWCGLSYDAPPIGNMVRLPVWPDGRAPTLPPTFDAIQNAPRVVNYSYSHTGKDGTRVYLYTSG